MKVLWLVFVTPLAITLAAPPAPGTESEETVGAELVPLTGKYVYGYGGAFYGPDQKKLNGDRLGIAWS